MKNNTNLVNEVIRAWVNNHIEDVPAVHRNGQYLIEYDTLVDHANNLDYNTLVEVMLEAEANYIVVNP